MQALGIEIRKANNIHNLYRDVDAVLGKQSLTYKPVSDDMKVQTTAHALNKMLKPDKWLDICCIKECAVLCGIVIPSERIEVYHPLHCIRWSEMLPEFRTKVIAMVLDDFRCVLMPSGGVEQ